MEHSNLISECTKQLQSRFMPNPVIIKKRIESLIEREYLERSKNDRLLFENNFNINPILEKCTNTWHKKGERTDKTLYHLHLSLDLKKKQKHIK